MVFRPLTGYTMAKGSYSRIFVGIVFRPLTGYTTNFDPVSLFDLPDSLPSPYGVYLVTGELLRRQAEDSLPSPYGVYRSSASSALTTVSDSLPSPYGVYQQKHPKSNRKTPSQPDVFYKYNFIISYPPPKRNPLKQIRITFLVRIQPLSLAHSMVKLRLRTKALPLLPYFKRKASS